jgi:hypothetical protein
MQRLKAKSTSLRDLSERALANLLEKAVADRDRDDHGAEDEEVETITASSSSTLSQLQLPATPSVLSPQRHQEVLAVVQSRRQSLANTPEPSLWEQERVAQLNQLAVGSMFEHFVVVGLRADSAISTASVRNEPQILYQYSPVADRKSDPSGLMDSVRHFCFPRGVATELLPKRASGSSVHTMLAGTDSQVFVFVLDSANEQLFGCCMVCREPLYDVGSWQTEPGAVQPAAPAAPGQQQARPKRLGAFYAPLGTRRAKPSPTKPAAPKPTSQRYIVVTDRCYCIVSRLPYFPLHFHVLRLFVGQERLIKLACVLGSADPLDQGLRPMDEVRAYGAATLARPGETLSVSLPGEPRDVSMPIPLGDTADEVRCRLIADWVIPTMVRHVSLMNLLQLFTAAMLEQRVVVRSGNANALACVVMSLKPLVLPFILRGLFVPVLSGHLLDYLQAPVPFLMGVMEECGAGDWVLLDIDVGRIDVPETMQLPRLPGYHRLVAKIKPHFLKVRELTKVNHSPLVNNSLQVAASRELAGAFHEWNQWLMKEVLEEHFLPLLRNRTLEPFGESAAQAKAKLIAKSDESHREFFEMFLNTQHVAVWIAALYAREMQRTSASS